MEPILWFPLMEAFLLARFFLAYKTNKTRLICGFLFCMLLLFTGFSYRRFVLWLNTSRLDDEEWRVLMKRLNASAPVKREKKRK